TQDWSSPGAELVVLEDAHLTDGGPQIERLVQACRNGRVRLVATGQAVQGAAARLVRDGILGHLPLTPLDHAGTGELVRRHLGGAASADVIRFVWQTSAGNPRYAIDLVESARSDGHLVHSGGTWVLTASPQPGSRILSQVEADLAPLRAA